MAGKYDFDRVIDRTATGSLKYDFRRAGAGSGDLLSMWVADMDFALPPEILAPVIERTGHGIFGYTEPDDSYYDVLEKWFSDQYHWCIDRKWNTVVPGVVYGIAAAIRATTDPGDAVLIQEPVYYPFREVILQNHRRCIRQQLAESERRYTANFSEFERLIRENSVKAFLLCSPHNPVGRVWTEEELHEMGNICIRNNVTVIADEIHCDFVYPENRFIPYGSLGTEYAQGAVICTSPSKTFNMAGLQVANILIPDPAVRKRFRAENSANGYSQSNTLGLAAAKAAYQSGAEWMTELKKYLKDNIDYMRTFLQEKLPKLRMIEPEGTYLVWVDFSAAVSDEKELQELVREKARLWLDDGGIFSEQSKLFERFNIACPRSVLRQALEQLEAVLNLK